MQFITLKEVLERTALTRTTLYRLMAAGKFPEKVSLGGTAVAWDKYEIEMWMEQRMVEREQT